MRMRVAIGMHVECNSKFGIMERGLLRTEYAAGYFGSVHIAKRTYNFLGRIGDERYYVTQVFWNDRIGWHKVIDSRMLFFQ